MHHRCRCEESNLTSESVPKMVNVLDELLVTYMSENQENTTGSSSFHSTGAVAAMTTLQLARTGR